MIAVDGVTHGYGDRLVLDGLSLAVSEGTVLGLIGPSGCGKTTALHLMAGLLQPWGGAVRNDFERTTLVFQEPRLLPWRSALANAAFGLRAQGVAPAERRRRAAALLTRIGVADAAHALLPRALSGGMRQRVALARALVTEPDLVLLDEPFAALDVGLRHELTTMMRSLIDERALTVVVVTHDLLDALRLADRIAVMAPAPSRIVHVEAVPAELRAGPEADLHEAAAALLRVPAVAAAFRVQ